MLLIAFIFQISVKFLSLDSYTWEVMRLIQVSSMILYVILLVIPVPINLFLLFSTFKLRYQDLF
jgi:hypothetical protein